MGGTIAIDCELCDEKMDWDPLSEDAKVCEDCLDELRVALKDRETIRVLKNKGEKKNGNRSFSDF